MKIRTGFVSNSSSSSYVIVGGILHFSQELFEAFELEYTEDTFCNYEEIQVLEAKLNKFYKPLGMDITSSYEGEYFLIGYNLEDTKNHTKSINDMIAECQSLMNTIPAEFKPASATLMAGEIHN